VVVHLPPDYTDAFARRLDGQGGLRVHEAREGLALAPGEVVIARGGLHLKLEREGERVVCRLDVQPTTHLHRPSVDALFASAVGAYGGAVLGVVLTGMGDDGLAGARAITGAGGRVVTESEASCVVYGMPRCIAEAGLSAAQASLEDMAKLIVDRL
jgi:two-component system chemotaxis response regulator CheB